MSSFCLVVFSAVFVIQCFLPFSPRSRYMETELEISWRCRVSWFSRKSPLTSRCRLQRARGNDGSARHAPSGRQPGRVRAWCSPFHSKPFNNTLRVQSAMDDTASLCTGCFSTQDMRVPGAIDDVSSHVKGCYPTQETRDRSALGCQGERCLPGPIA